MTTLAYAAVPIGLVLFMVLIGWLARIVSHSQKKHLSVHVSHKSNPTAKTVEKPMHLISNVKYFLVAD